MSSSTKVAIKESKLERESHEQEKKDGTLPPAMLPIGAGQLEKALPATRLLEKRRLVHIVHEELQRQKIEFVKKEEILQKREDALRDKDLAMQESLIGFSRFLQENAIKKKRAEKKSSDEIRMRLEKEQEIIHLEDALEKLKEKRSITLIQLERMVMYQKYLESILEKATQFHEINDLMLRHATLATSHEELKGHIADCEAKIDSIRSELQNYMKNSANTILSLNNDISVTKQKAEGMRQETTNLQLNIDSIFQIVAAKTLARSQICMAAENLFYRIDKGSVIARPVQDNPLKNLDMVADYITDLSYIQKAYKGFLAKTSPK